MKLAKISFAALAVALAAAFAGVGLPDAAHSSPEPDRTISVGGTGTVTVVPDRARFSFGVDTRGATASEALAANAAEMRRVIAALEAAGVDERDVQTQQVSLSPIYSDGGGSVTGYSASNSVGVTIHGLAGAGALIDRAVAAGANEVYGPALDREDQAALYRKALEAALAEARAKAETIASASALTLGRATRVEETTEGAPVPVPYARADAALSASTPVEAGTSSVEASVSVTFAAS